ncbi:MAG: hypothetical protein GX945_09195 [Lentisphaerae bacterium]|nr:hypothetical protein [Lentisphaerota bacterium]
MLSVSQITTPPPECSPAYFWQINGQVDIPMLIEELRDMHANGLNAVCLHPFPDEFRPKMNPARVNIPYLSPEWFAMTRALCKECRRLGMNYWLYDEGGWPSGGAGGQVWQNAKDKEAVQQRVYKLENGQAVLKIVGVNPQVSAPYPDVLNPAVTREFLRLTHEQYAKHLGEFFGREITFVFTDEPGTHYCPPGALGTTSDFIAQFRKLKGYDVTPFLPALLCVEKDDEPNEVTTARIDYHDVLATLFVRRFLAPIRRWCRRHGLLSGGHFSGEDKPEYNRFGSYGSIMRSLRMLDVPGVDAIWRQLFPDERVHSFPKYASSAAHQNGNRFALAEIFAVYGNALSPSEMRWLVDYMLVRGINLIVPSKISTCHREHFMSGIRPHFGRVNPLWPYMKEYHQYIERSCHLLSLGKPQCPNAVYFDIRSIWAGGKAMTEAVRLHEEVAQTMSEKQCDFDYVDDDALAKARVKNCSLLVGKMRYRCLVIPSATHMSDAAKNTLRTFTAAGGRVLNADEAGAAERSVIISPDNPAIRVCKRAVGSNAIYFVVNESAETQSFTITLPEKKAVSHYSPEENRVTALISEQGRFSWQLPAYSATFFITGAIAGIGKPRQTKPTAQTVLQRLDGAWTLQPKRRIYPGHDDFVREELHESARPCALGDWRPILGDDFSGEATYRCSFTLAKRQRQSIILDLGKVGYACKVSVNGKALAPKFLPPYRFDISAVVQVGKNYLEITVANTLANALSPDAVLKAWAEKWPLQYEEKQRPFEKTNLESGLFGPVVLLGE